MPWWPSRGTALLALGVVGWTLGCSASGCGGCGEGSGGAGPDPEAMTRHAFRQGDGVVEIGAGDLHACARYEDGRVFCWGNNMLEQIAPRRYGDPSADPGRTLVAPRDVIRDARTLGVGAVGTCITRDRGVVRCWGSNVFRTMDAVALDEMSLHPLDAVLAGDDTRVAAGGGTNCAWSIGGPVWCWGANEHGEVGLPSEQSPAREHMVPVVPEPTRIAGLTARAVVVAGDHACALAPDRRVLCWGMNHQGQLGDGGTTDRPTPAPVTGLANVVQLAAAAQATCALDVEGAVRCWGRNEHLQLGVAEEGLPQRGFGSDTFTFSPRPVRVQGLPPAVQVAVGGEHACAVDRDAAVWCWGGNRGSQRGDGDVAPRAQPARVAGIADVVQIAASSSFSHAFTCALRRDGAVLCWGDNEEGQLGSVTPPMSSRPVRVPL